MTEQQAGVRRQRRRSRAEADQLAAEYEASGLTRREFCAGNGVPMNTLARYIARHRRGKTDSGGIQRWVAVDVAEQSGHRDELVVVLPSGRRIEVRCGFDADTLRRLVAELERV